MKRSASYLDLYAITKDDLDVEYQINAVEKAIKGGITCLQFRSKDKDIERKHLVASKLNELCLKYEIPFIINDDVKLAEKLEINKIHLGQEDLEEHNLDELISKGYEIGVSIHTLKQAIALQKYDISYFGVGSVFHTQSKDDAKAVSLLELHKISCASRIPIVALGGVTLNNIIEFRNIDIDGVALISGIFDKDDIESETRKLKNMIVSMKEEPSMKKVLTIAGNDGSGGAGVQADLKTMSAHGIYGMSVFSALPVQNTTGVESIYSLEDDFITQQIDSIVLDIRPDALKIGMVFTKEIIEIVVAKIEDYQLDNIVLDPVMVSTSNHRLIDEDAINALKYKLIPLANIITPNIKEAEILADIEITNQQTMIEAAKLISEYYQGVILIKGGHLKDSSDDLIYYREGCIWLRQERINNDNTHGTGCTLSAAIASNLALGYSKIDAIIKAKEYLSDCLNKQVNIGYGQGPLQHF